MATIPKKEDVIRADTSSGQEFLDERHRTATGTASWRGGILE
jgi:hypothetical protein